MNVSFQEPSKSEKKGSSLAAKACHGMRGQPRKQTSLRAILTMNRTTMTVVKKEDKKERRQEGGHQVALTFKSPGAEDHGGRLE